MLVPSIKISDVYELSQDALGLPTPPDPDKPVNKDASGTAGAASTTISSSFFPGAHDSISDISFRSSDNVLFYVNRQDILRGSPKAFAQFLQPEPEPGPPPDTQIHPGSGGAVGAAIDIPESSAVLDVLLHTLCSLSGAQHQPPFAVLERSVYRMPVYGITPTTYIVPSPSSPLFDLLLAYAPLHPLGVYTLAANFAVHELAVQASAHLLSYNLAELTDELCMRIGSVYLNRLMGLHVRTLDKLKEVILKPPNMHATKSMQCDEERRNRLSGAWALTASYLTWDANPGQFHLILPPSSATPPKGK